jgi:ribosomal-protein-alanine N-acetyltransferase
MLQLERHAPPAAHWSAAQYEELLAGKNVEGLSDRFAWVAEPEIVEPKPGAHSSAVETAQIFAFLIAGRVGADWELENMVVAESGRRRGVGTLLLEELIKYARTQGADDIFLEVRESNLGARALYLKLGFEEVGLRRSYYSSPPEDSILYRLDF